MRNGTNRKRSLELRKARMAFLSLGMLGLILILLAAERLCEPGDCGTLAGLRSNSSYPPQGFRAAWYIRSGQWRADLRSLVAVLEYLREPAGIGQTNGLPPGSRGSV